MTKGSAPVATVLVLANETIGGGKLLDAIKERAEQGDVRFHVVVPKVRPRHGNVIYDETVRDCAQVRIDLALEFMDDHGIQATGEVGDQDPLNAALDALRDQPADEIIVSTLPSGQSGWLKRDIVNRLEQSTGLPVRHVVVDLARDGLPFDVCLVVANLTIGAPELVERLKALAADRPHRFIAVVPQANVTGAAATEARSRLDSLLKSLDESGIVAAGMIGDPDPYTAARNALEYFHLSEIVISTLPSNRSAWIEKGLIEKLERDSGKRVIHVESSAETAEAPA
jgi:hypothetical protein